MQVSLFASAVRPKLWPALFKSLEGTSVKYEAIFAGNNRKLNRLEGIEFYDPFKGMESYFKDTSTMPSNFKYIETGNIKPAQCYEIARRHCTGETVVWIADDCEFPNDVIGKAYKYWKSQNNEKLILSIQTAESGYNQEECALFDMKQHRFYGGEAGGPLMAPIALMSRKFLDELGGLDNRYICGQYENDIVMRAYSQGAVVEIFGDKDCYVEIDHLKKSKEIGESTNIEEFFNRPFAKGYANDRAVLENSWTTYDNVYAFKLLESGKNIKTHASLRKIHDKQVDQFHPYSKDISYNKSEGNNLVDMWE